MGKKFTIRRKKESKHEPRNAAAGTVGEERGKEDAVTSGDWGDESGPDVAAGGDAELPTRLDSDDRAVSSGTEIVHVVEGATLEARQPESVTLSAEGSVHLPIVVNEAVDLEAEKAKADVLPKFACSTCSISTECPEFKEGYVCAFNKAFDRFDVRNVHSVIEAMRSIVNTNKRRLFRALLSEELTSGGQLDMAVTRQSEVVLLQMEKLVRLSTEVKKVSVQMTGSGAIAAADGGGGGVLSRLFGAPDKPADIELNLATEADVEDQSQEGEPVEGEEDVYDEEDEDMPVEEGMVELTVPEEGEDDDLETLPEPKEEDGADPDPIV